MGKGNPDHGDMIHSVIATSNAKVAAGHDVTKSVLVSQKLDRKEVVLPKACIRILFHHLAF